MLIIDEIDTATNNPVFLDFLAQLRNGYIGRDTKGTPSFQSVILAGVTDIKNLKRKLRPDETHKFNSPWNIAADFTLDMSLSVNGIKGMLSSYENDHHTVMDVEAVAKEIYAFTNGYPFLVSRICQLIDTLLWDPLDPKKKNAWSIPGVSEAVRRILMAKNTLFDSLMGKVQDNEELRSILKRILFAGDSVSYNPDSISISDAEMYGLVRNDHGKVVIANRIFETRLYNFFLSARELQEFAI